MSTGNDFFYTGGGFSDWSGSSAGKFSGGSSSDGGSVSDFSYLSTKEKEKIQALREEKRHGLPFDAHELPTLLNVWGITNRIIWLIALIGVQMLLSYLFVCDPKREMLWTSGILYFFTLIGTFYYSLTIANWYPIWKSNVTRVRVKRFLLLQQSLVIWTMIISLFLLLTPLWCTIAADYLVEHNDWLIKPHLFYEPFNSKRLWWVFAVMIYYAVSPVAVIIGLIRFPLVSEKNVKARFTYLLYRADMMAEAEKKRLEEIARKHEEIAHHTVEIEKLKREIEELEKPGKR